MTDKNNGDYKFEQDKKEETDLDIRLKDKTG
jgi:hypothetical protein